MTPPTISREDLLEFETFLFDADGVLWMGDVPIPGAIEFVSALQDAGKRTFIISNNPTKTMDQYMSKISRLGFQGFTKDNVVNAGVVMAAYIKNRQDFAGKQVYLLGTETLKTTLESEGNVHCFGTGPDHFRDYSDHDFVFNMDFSAKPKAVVASYDPHFSYPKIMKAVNYLQRDDVEFLVTDEDQTFPGPIPGVVLPGSGAISSCIRAVSGRIPLVFGKPHKPMAEFLREKGHIDPKKTVMFGDRLDTDIQFANENGFTSCLMLTGVHSLDDVVEAERRGQKNLVPNYIFSFLSR
uniref:Haloacid dehalogenase hydrolase domain containing protein n=2 Tax=Haemonchus contortus TaxID=6289 RepID=A0A7I4YDF9_HAECO